MPEDDVSVEGPWDLVVVGHGAAGLSAAASFLESSSGEVPRVAVLDRASFERRGGSSAWTTASLRLDDDEELDPLWGDVVRRTAGEEANEAYIEAFYEHAVDTLNWIRRRGVKVLRIPGVSPPGWPHRNGHMLEGGGRAFVDVFTEVVRAGGASCRYDVDLVGLERDGDGPVTGVRVRTADGAEHLMATRAVVLACGGFEGNPEMLGAHIPGAEVLETVSPGTQVNNGMGIEAAAAVGAARAGQYSGAHLEPVDPRCDLPEPLVSSWMWGILVDPEGQRFMDEAAESYDVQFDYVAKAVHARGGLAYAISDAGVRAGAPLFDLYNYTNVPPVTADSIEELAQLLELDPVALRRTVDEYNAASTDAPYDGSVLDGKRTEGLVPPKSHWAQPLTRPPFEAWPVTPQICFTFGGLGVDGEARVLDEGGRPIPGLYAAGEITGVFHGDTYPAGTSVLRSLTFGRIAGRQAAAALRAPAV